MRGEINNTETTKQQKGIMKLRADSSKKLIKWIKPQPALSMRKEKINKFKKSQMREERSQSTPEK